MFNSLTLTHNVFITTYGARVLLRILGLLKVHQDMAACRKLAQFKTTPYSSLPTPTSRGVSAV